MVLHGFSFGLLAFEICTVDHHSKDAILEGENNGLGEGFGERASATVNSQSGGRSMDNHSVLVFEHKNCHCGGGWLGQFDLHGLSLDVYVLSHVSHFSPCACVNEVGMVAQ